MICSIWFSNVKSLFWETHRTWNFLQNDIKNRSLFSCVYHDKRKHNQRGGKNMGNLIAKDTDMSTKEKKNVFGNTQNSKN